ncbi:hypothetical protein NDU88_005544 [Pleurodeles waltl]|uniref:Uncharacterized protein n=1 Tax=Pleurodeles waltl TaxID=8319 RepID=A0AAV7L4W5_PLEWA|nr:hypothetical protein NDU88_005544 [Pleurodeles waltl]
MSKTSHCSSADSKKSRRVVTTHNRSSTSLAAQLKQGAISRHQNHGHHNHVLCITSCQRQRIEPKERLGTLYLKLRMLWTSLQELLFRITALHNERWRSLLDVSSYLAQKILR